MANKCAASGPALALVALSTSCSTTPSAPPVATSGESAAPAPLTDLPFEAPRITTEKRPNALDVTRLERVGQLLPVAALLFAGTSSHDSTDVVLVETLRRVLDDALPNGHRVRRFTDALGLGVSIDMPADGSEEVVAALTEALTNPFPTESVEGARRAVMSAMADGSRGGGPS